MISKQHSFIPLLFPLPTINLVTNIMMSKIIDVHPSGTARLPAEVFDRIVGELRKTNKEDKKLLKTLSLVCQRFRKTVQAELYSSVDIITDISDNHYNLPNIAGLASCIEARPELGRNILRLVYYFKSEEDESIISASDNMDVFLRLSSRITLLAIFAENADAMRADPANILPYIPKSNPKFGYSALLDAYTSPGSRLAVLCLQGITVPLYDILVACTHLEQLKLDMVSITPSSPLPASIIRKGFPLTVLSLKRDIWHFPAELFTYLPNVRFLRLDGIMREMTGSVPDTVVFEHLLDLYVGAGHGIWSAFRGGDTGRHGEIFPNFPKMRVTLPSVRQLQEEAFVDIKRALQLMESCPYMELVSMSIHSF